MKKKPQKTVRRIKDLPPQSSLAFVRFRYPGDGQIYYWASQWEKGVWGKKDPCSPRLFPLHCGDLKEALEWEVVDE